MLLMLLIGWIVLLPAIVVAGLYVGSIVLGRRRGAALNVYEDLLADGEAPEGDAHEVTPEAITGEAAAGAGRRATSSGAPASDVPPVSAGY